MRLRTRRLKRLALRSVLTVVDHPRLTLLIAGIVLAACVLLGVFRLPVSTDQNKLFSADVPFFRDYLEFNRLFPENEAVYVILESSDPRRPPALHRWTAAADAIVAGLRQQTDVVKSVWARIPPEQLGEQGLLFDDPILVPERFADVQRFLPLVRLWAEPPTLLTRPLGSSPTQRFLAALRAQQVLSSVGSPTSNSAELAPFLTELARSWDHALADPPAPLRPGEGLPDLNSLGAETPRDLGYSYVADQTNPSRHLLIVQVFPTENYTSLTAVSQTVETIRRSVREAARPFPEFKVGVTGRPALEADEMRTTDRDSTIAEIVALSAVFVGLVLMLRSVWLAVAAELCLGVGIGWTFGWASLAVGELNLLSIVFLIALIGIGMDYLVQVLSRYRRELGRRRNPRTLWVAVFRQVAAPITTACLGAAGAFLVSVFTRFQGAADLGIIAGGGLILCLISGYTVLPALLTVFPAKVKRHPLSPEYRGEGRGEGPGAEWMKDEERRMKGRIDPPQLHPSSVSLHPYHESPSPQPAPPGKRERGKLRRWLPPLIWLTLLLGLSPFALRSAFDPGLISLQAPNLESVKLVAKLQTWSAVVLSKDPDVLRRARDAVKGSPFVAGTESVLSAYDNAEWLRQHAADLPPVRWTDPTPVGANDLPAIADAARALAVQFEATGTSGSAHAELVTAARALRAFADRLAAAPNDAAAAGLSAWQAAFVGQLREMLAQFNPGPPQLDKLPRELREHFVAPDGTYALYIYPKGDLWQRTALAQFVRDVERRLRAAPGDLPEPTGIAVNVFHTTSQIRRAFLRATAYALALIVVLVMIDLRRFVQTLLAVSVLAFGLPMLVCLMGLLGVSWNFANFFGLPILIGAGHEYGVFMVHRYREAKRDPTRRAWKGWDVSDWALLLCAYVTSASFGFYWLLGHHRGLRSLGLVMALGTACIYLATVAVVRPILKWKLERAASSAR